jgi:hypothetical protein
MSSVVVGKSDGATVEELRRKLHELLKDVIEVLVDDIGISVTAALSDDEIEKLVMEILREAKRPLSWRELKSIFSGVVGEDRLRKILISLKVRNLIAELTRTRYSLPEYVPPQEYNKVKNPLILRKIKGGNITSPEAYYQ